MELLLLKLKRIRKFLNFLCRDVVTCKGGCCLSWKNSGGDNQTKQLIVLVGVVVAENYKKYS